MSECTSEKRAYLDEVSGLLLGGLVTTSIVRWPRAQKGWRPAAAHLVQHAFGGTSLRNLLAVAFAFSLYFANGARCHEYLKNHFYDKLLIIKSKQKYI